MVSSGAEVAVGLAAGVPRSARETALAAMLVTFFLTSLLRRAREARIMVWWMLIGVLVRAVVGGGVGSLNERRHCMMRCDDC